jgi:hypothetical protein
MDNSDNEYEILHIVKRPEGLREKEGRYVYIYICIYVYIYVMGGL